jgi:hypothetical protein
LGHPPGLVVMPGPQTTVLLPMPPL